MRGDGVRDVLGRRRRDRGVSGPTIASFASQPAVQGVYSTSPGATALTRTSGASACARVRVR